MKLLKQVIQVNQLKYIGLVLNTLIRDKESDGLYSRQSPAKILIISDNLEKATYVTEVIANRMLKPNGFAIKTKRDQEQHIQLNLIAGLPCEVYTRLSCNITPLGLQHCDYILYIEPNQLDQYVQNTDCNVIIFENIYNHDAHSDEIINCIRDDKTDKDRPSVYNLLTVGSNLDESWNMFHNICLKCEYLQANSNMSHEDIQVRKNNMDHIESVIRAIPGIPITFSWFDNECFNPKDLFGQYYIILMDEIM